MDPITHGLAGGLVAKSGLAHRLLPPELENRGVALTAIAALAPDIDAVVELGPDPLAFLRYHRGLTHSILGGIGLAAVLAMLVAPFFPGVPRRRLFALTTAGVYVHILLDLLTSYGTVLLYPFRSERFTLDWMWTFDPTFLGILFCCLLGVYLLRRAPRRAAQVGLSVAVGYVLLAGALQWVANHTGRRFCSVERPRRRPLDDLDALDVVRVQVVEHARCTPFRALFLETSVFDRRAGVGGVVDPYAVDVDEGVGGQGEAPDAPDPDRRAGAHVSGPPCELEARSSSRQQLLHV